MTHVAVRSSNIEESIDFYRRYAGLHIVHQRGNGSTRVVWMSHNEKDPEFVIVLLEMPYEKLHEPTPMDHFGFAVDSREEVDRIAALGVEDNRLKWGPAEGGPIVGYFVMVRDPSGNTCEFSFGQPIHPRQIPN
jgi:catechol 2,3-dioxygenase-like lactoylglutathione lyase family enzyme